MKKLNLLKINWIYFMVLLLIIYVPFLVIVKLHFDSTVDLELNKDTLFYYQGFEKTFDRIDSRMSQALGNVRLLTGQAGVKRGLEIYSTLEDERAGLLAEFMGEQVVILKERETMVGSVILVSHTGDVFVYESDVVDLNGAVLLGHIQEQLVAEQPTFIASEALAEILGMTLGVIEPVYGVADDTITSYALVEIILDPLNLRTDFDLGVTKYLAAEDSLLWGRDFEDLSEDREFIETFEKQLEALPWVYREKLDVALLSGVIGEKVNQSFSYYLWISLVSILLMALIFYLLLENRKQQQIRLVTYQLAEENHQKLLVYKHDIMNHLQVITGLLEMETPDKALGYIQQLSKNSSYAMAKYDLGVPEIEVLIFSFVQRSKELGITFHVSLMHMPDFSLDVFKVNTIITNLLKNAFEATAAAEDMGSGKHVSLTMTALEDAYNITVHNNLPLIPEHMRETIFERNVTTNGENRGLGLHIVTTTVASMQGHLKLYVEPSGNTFSVTLPR